MSRCMSLFAVSLLILLCAACVRSSVLAPLPEAEAPLPTGYTCADYLAAWEEPFLAVLFMDGYAVRRMGSTVCDGGAIRAVIEDGAFREQCEKSPQMLATAAWLDVRARFSSMPASGKAASTEPVNPEEAPHDFGRLTYAQLQAAKDGWLRDHDVLAIWLMGWLYADPGGWPGSPANLLAEENDSFFDRAAQAFEDSWPLHPDETALERMRKVLAEELLRKK